MAGVLAQQITDRYAIYNADCMDVLREIPDESIHATVYSPPFAGLYHYSSSDRDLSNARTTEEFWDHYGIILDELTRVTIPGRISGVHTAPVPSSNSGRDSLSDFPGDVIRLHEAHGWDWIAEHAIWKEPLSVRNRTMQHNLSHKTIVEDGAMGGVASADQLLIFRKRGGAPLPAQHPTGLHDYAGSTSMPADLLKFRAWEGKQTANRYSHWIWRRYASSVWDDIRGDRVLPFRDAKDEEDEKHVHPLQLDVIARFIQLRTMPGERILTPFMGVGSEVYETVRQGRVGIGIELKPSYYVQAVRNMEAIDDDQLLDASLFDELESPEDGLE